MKHLTTIAFSLIALAGSRSAQFAGDVFFQPASVVLNQGQEMDVDLVTFVGSQNLGALTVELSLPGSELELISINGVAPDYDEGLLSSRTGDVLRLTLLKEPLVPGQFGTVPIARLRLRSNSPIGSQLAITSRVIDSLDLALNPYGSKSGFGLNLTVGLSSPIVSSQARSQPHAGAANARRPLSDWADSPFLVPPGPLGAEATWHALNRADGLIYSYKYTSYDYLAPSDRYPSISSQTQR